MKPVHVFITGAVVAVIVGLGLFFLLVKPSQDKLAQLTTTNEGLLAGIQQNSNAQSLLDKAEKDAAAAKAAWAVKMRRQDPPPQYAIPVGTPDERLRTMDKWWLLPDAVRRETEQFARGMSGVQVETAFTVPAPSPDPNAIPQDVVVFPLGAMAATGSFKNVLAWARRWNSFRYTNAVDGFNIQLVGPNGRVRGTASLTLYIFPKVPPGSFQAPGGGATQGGFGGSGGMGGGSGGMGASDSGGGMGATPMGGGAGGGGSTGGGATPGGDAGGGGGSFSNTDMAQPPK